MPCQTVPSLQRHLFWLPFLLVQRRLLQEGTPTVPISEGVLQPSADGPSSVNYVTFEDLVPPGPAVVKAHVVDSVEACWRECLASQPCNVFAYCSLEVSMAPDCGGGGSALRVVACVSLEP